MDSADGRYELWIYAPGNVHFPVQECGFFRSEQDAQVAGVAVRHWITRGLWYDATFRLLAPDAEDRKSLFEMGEFLRGRGVDPAGVVVTYRDVTDGDNHQFRADAGHAVRGPHTTHAKGVRR